MAMFLPFFENANSPHSGIHQGRLRARLLSLHLLKGRCITGAYWYCILSHLEGCICLNNCPADKHMDFGGSIEGLQDVPLLPLSS